MKQHIHVKNHLSLNIIYKKSLALAVTVQNMKNAIPWLKNKQTDLRGDLQNDKDSNKVISDHLVRSCNKTIDMR